jgi:hypothetical protein
MALKTNEGSEPMAEKETYLGDGLYVSFDGFQFRLRAPRDHGDDLVYLDRYALSAFIEYAQAMGVMKVKP